MTEFVDENEAVLFEASKFGRTDILQHVIGSIRSNDGNFLSFDEVGKAISVQRTEDEVTPLHIAAAFGHADAVRALLNAGADPTLVPIRGRFASFSPYQVAQDKAVSAFHVYLFEQIALGNIETIKRLIKAGISLNISDGSSTEDTPLHWACSFNKLEVAGALIEGGANVNILNSSNESPLHVLCKLPAGADKVELLMLLLQEGADASLRDCKGHTAGEVVKDTDKDSVLALNSNPLPTMEHTNTYKQSGMSDPDQLEAARVAAVIVAQEYVQSVMINAQSPKDPSRSETSATLPSAGTDAERPVTNILAKDSNAAPAGAAALSVAATRAPDENDDCYVDEYDLFGDSGGVVAGDGDSGSEESSLPQLVLWPPAQRQRRTSATPLVLSNEEVLYISFHAVDARASEAVPDVAAFLAISGCADLFEQAKFKVQVRNTSCDSKIRIVINQNICPGRHKYKLIVNASHIEILSSDSVGLMYALYILVQLMQLHSEKVVSKRAVVNVAESIEVLVPAIEITDWPDVANRAVVWSYRSAVQSSTATLCDIVELLSKSRINQFFLVVDAENAQSSTEAPSTQEMPDLASRIYILEDLCRQYCVELIPFVMINNVADSVPTDVLRNFSSPLMSLSFLYKRPVRISNADADVEAEAVATHLSHCEGVLRSCRNAGFISLVLSASKWAEHAVSPLSIARNAIGFSGGVVSFDLDYIFPPSLAVKPLIGSMQSYTALLSYHAMRAFDHGQSTMFLSLLQEQEFIYPVILLKFIFLMFGGVSWNRICVIDMLGTELLDMPLLQKVACWLIFVTQWHLATDETKLFLDCLTSNRGQVSSATSPAGNGANGQDASGADGLSRTQSTSSMNSIGLSSGHSSNANMSNYIPAADDFAYAESTLVSMLTCNISICHFTAPSKLDTAYCLKISRRILNAARWKMTSNAPKSFFEFVTGTGAGSSSNVGASKTSNSSRGPSGDASTCTSAAQVIATLQKDREYYSSSSLDEYYSLLNIFSILCRTIIMAYNAMEKQQSKYAAGAGISTDSVAAVSGTVSMNDLMHILPPGMKSDLANSFLEGMEYAMNNWKKRLLCIRFSSIDFYSPLAAYNSPDGRDTQNGVRVRKDRDVISYARKRYLHTDPVVTGGGGIVSVHDKSASPNLPLVGVFYAISESLPIVSNVQDALLRMIQEFRVTALTTSKA